TFTKDPYSEKRTIGWWEVARPSPSYALGTPVKSLALNKDGTRLAVNDMICEVVERRHGHELLSWSTPAKGLVPQFVGKDEVWTFSVQGATRETPKIQTTLWQLAPQRRKVDVPLLPFPEAEALAALLTKGAAKAGQPERFHAASGTQLGAFCPEGRVFFRKGDVGCVGFVEAVPKGAKAAGGESSGGAPPFNVLEVWDYEKGKRLALLDKEVVTCIQFTPDGRRAATGSTVGIKIWNTATGQVEKHHPGPDAEGRVFTHPVSDLTFSRNGRRLL